MQELQQSLVAQLTPASLHPRDPNGVLLALERAFTDGLAELEQAGHSTAGITLYDYFARLAYLEKKQISTNT